MTIVLKVLAFGRQTPPAFTYSNLYHHVEVCLLYSCVSPLSLHGRLVLPCVFCVHGVSTVDDYASMWDRKIEVDFTEVDLVGVDL